MPLGDFFYRYFVYPMKAGLGYNFINTTVYAFLFVFLTYMTYKILEKFSIKPDKRLVLSITPWIIFGILLRIAEDAGVIKGYIFMTPNIWLLFLFLIISFLIISRSFEKRFKIPYFKLMFISGIIFSSFLFPLLILRNPKGLLYFLLWFSPWLVFLKIIKWTVENKFVLGLHLFDSTATFVSLQYFNYFEQHVIPRLIIEATNTPFSFVIVKLIVVSFVLILLDKNSEDKDFIAYLKIIIGMLGFITGLRDLLRLLLLV